MHRLVLVIILAVLGFVPSVARADCAMWGLAPKVLTPASALVSRDGGIVVASIPEARGKLDPGDPAVQSSWRITIAGDSIKPPIDVLAPGLAVYRVAVANAFKVELTNGDKVLATVRPTRDRIDPLAAPKVTRVWFEDARSRHSITRVGVELEGDAPAGAVALVMADDQGVPRSWALAGAGKGRTLYTYSSGDCLALPNGTIPSKAGDKITLSWVDSTGLRSAATKPLQIGAAP
jgi:hypothetical protein